MSKKKQGEFMHYIRLKTDHKKCISRARYTALIKKLFSKYKTLKEQVAKQKAKHTTRNIMAEFELNRCYRQIIGYQEMVANKWQDWDMDIQIVEKDEIEKNQDKVEALKLKEVAWTEEEAHIRQIFGWDKDPSNKAPIKEKYKLAYSKLLRKMPKDKITAFHIKNMICFQENGMSLKNYHKSLNPDFPWYSTMTDDYRFACENF